MALFGLLVNGVSVFILDERHDHDIEDQDKAVGNDNHHDHNLRAAYLHVLADALTSILAIFALLAGKYLGLNWMDPLMGIIGAVLVSRWSIGLIKSTSGVLLDRQGPENLEIKIKNIFEEKGDALVTDLHLWSIGPNIYSVIISILTESPKTPSNYKDQLPKDLVLAHVSIEVNKPNKIDRHF